MASKEPSSFSKIPKLRSSAPNSPRVPTTPPASKVARKPIFEKSKSNLSSTSRIPQAASLTFRKRQVSSIPRSTPATPPTPVSKSRLPTLQSQGSKIPTTSRSNIPSLRCTGAVPRSKREVTKEPELPAIPVSQLAPIMDQRSAKSQGDTLLVSRNEPMSPIKKKPELEVIHDAPINSSKSISSISAPSLVEFEVAELELEASHSGEVTPDSVLKAQRFFEEVAQSAAVASLEISPQHFQLPFSTILTPLGGTASQDFILPKEKPTFVDKTVMASIPHQDAPTWSNNTSTVDKCIKVSESVVMLEAKPSLIQISPKESTTGSPSLVVEDFQWSVPGTEAVDEIIQRPKPPVGIDVQPRPYAYGESFQLCKVPEDSPIVEKGNPLIENLEIDTEENSETDQDYGYFYEDEEEDDLDDTEEDSASDMDQGDSNDVLLLSTMIHSKVNDGHGGGRKTKTIFSVDAPTAQAQKENGPGVNGDGVGAPRRPSSKIVSSSTSRAKEEIHVLFRKDRKVALQYENVNTEEDEDEMQEWPEQEDKCPRLNTANGYIEILPKVASNSQRRLSSSTGSQCPKAFSLILQRSSEKIGKEFSKSLDISNMTPVLHGFKVWCNSSAYTHLDITPTFGLIQPGRRFSVEISTKNPGNRLMKYDMEKHRIEVKIFPAYCSNLDELEQYYKKLKEQRPDLISSQPIQRMILWDAGDISGRLELFKSIEDEEELDLLKEELHNIQLGQCPSEKSSTTAVSSLLDNLKCQITQAEQGIKENIMTISGIKNLQNVGFLMMFFFIMGSLLLPICFRKDLGTKQALPQPVVAEIRMWDLMLKMLGLK